jgi:hypothetical protein
MEVFIKFSVVFVAPEVVVREKATKASDVWGVGTITFLL